MKKQLLFILLTSISCVYNNTAKAMAAAQPTREELGQQLMAAINGQNVDSVRELINQGAPLDYQDLDSDNTPLHLAARFGNNEIVGLLLNQGTIREIRDDRARGNVLHSLMAFNELFPAEEIPFVPDVTFSVLQPLMCTHNSMYMRNQLGRTPLATAILHGNLHTASLLISAGANINDTDLSGRTPLHNAIIFNQPNEVMEYLLAHGARINARDQKGYTPLHTAALKGYGNDVRFLIEHGADINAQCDEGFTPLAIAVLIGSHTALEQLIANGANINIPDRRSQTPLIFATIRTDEFPTSPEFIANFQTLLAHGAEVNVQDIDGNTALNFTHNDDITQMLINAGGHNPRTQRINSFIGSCCIATAAAVAVLASTLAYFRS